MIASPIIAIFQSLGAPEFLLIFLIILLLFGAKRLPELAKGLGKSMKEFKKATQNVEEDFREAMDAADPNKPDPDSAPKAKPPAPASTPKETTSTKSSS